MLLLTLAAGLGGCTSPTQPEAAAPPPSPAAEVPVRTSVTDLAAFDAFIATRPTPEALRQRYPGLAVVMPGDITTKELRMDNSRYFVELDAQGRVTGGRFQ
ncbi:MAG: hypothetical protein ACREUE_06550 [Panacagrimonas sp.]